jgi:hypothetical protein
MATAVPVNSGPSLQLGPVACERGGGPRLHRDDGGAQGTIDYEDGVTTNPAAMRCRPPV